MNPAFIEAQINDFKADKVRLNGKIAAINAILNGTDNVNPARAQRLTEML